eukprot:782191-Alexandrium_andersonii.AAC.1
MSASLVGSEMCIRDSPGPSPTGASGARGLTGGATATRTPQMAPPARRRRQSGGGPGASVARR